MIKLKAITGGFGFVCPRRSPLVQDISSSIMRLREVKRLEMMENKWFNSESSFTTLDPESNFNRLHIHSFGGLFLVTGISSISALVVCLFQKRQSIKIQLNSSVDSLKGYFNVKIIGRQKERS